MSLKKVSNDSHSGHTLMPRAPYHGYALLRGLLHLVFMSIHAAYIRVSRIPCVVLRWMQMFLFCSLSKQPQEFESPPRNTCPSISFLLPHTHPQSQSQRLFELSRVLYKTVKRPNFKLVKSIKPAISTLASLFERFTIHLSATGVNGRLQNICGCFNMYKRKGIQQCH